MTLEAETVAMDLNIVSCQTCDALFIESERRQTCPSCGGPPVGPYFQFVLDGAGLRLKDGAAPAAAPAPPAEEPAPEPEAPAPEAPAEEAAPPAEEETNWQEVFAEGIATYLQGGGITEDDLRTVLENQLGAEPEAAKTAVGRIMAVRVLLCQLAEAGVEAQVEVTVEETPAEAPDAEQREP